MNNKEEIFQELKNLVLNFYKDRLVSLAVFGSYARGTAGVDSDLDLFLLIKNLPNGRIARVSEWMEVEKSWTKTIFLSPIFYTPEELKFGGIVFLDMTQGEVIHLFDDERTFQSYLIDLTLRLEKMGSKKIGKGKDSYWVMGRKSGHEVVI